MKQTTKDTANFSDANHVRFNLQYTFLKTHSHNTVVTTCSTNAGNLVC